MNNNCLNKYLILDSKSLEKIHGGSHNKAWHIGHGATTGWSDLGDGIGSMWGGIWNGLNGH
ncbi:hypothetical protein [Lacticaseibacillus paracasei]|uniref:hypothetical protein n=1 Tax=Lacticaseibacillus paracasei TaxID=1597 RepID=UPI0034E86C58